jgi:hypothetical protein
VACALFPLQQHLRSAVQFFLLSSLGVSQDSLFCSFLHALKRPFSVLYGEWETLHATVSSGIFQSILLSVFGKHRLEIDMKSESTSLNDLKSK